MKYCVRSERGKVRQNNEDSYFVLTNDINLFIVADGMGGHLAGDTASKMAVSIISEYILENYESSNLPEIITKAIDLANEKIYSESQSVENYRGMGTTVSLVLLDNEKIYYANIGDSRVYVLKDGEFTQMTQDDSFVNYLVKIGDISHEEAKIHPKKNVLTKAVGTYGKLEIEVNSLETEKGDYLLICSDGLSNMLDDEVIRSTILKEDFEKIGDSLIDMAYDSGGLDNITFILIDLK